MDLPSCTGTALLIGTIPTFFHPAQYLMRLSVGPVWMVQNLLTSAVRQESRHLNNSNLSGVRVPNSTGPLSGQTRCGNDYRASRKALEYDVCGPLSGVSLGEHEGGVHCEQLPTVPM